MQKLLCLLLCFLIFFFNTFLFLHLSILLSTFHHPIFSSYILSSFILSHFPLYWNTGTSYLHFIRKSSWTTVFFCTQDYICWGPEKPLRGMGPSICIVEGKQPFFIVLMYFIVPGLHILWSNPYFYYMFCNLPMQ